MGARSDVPALTDIRAVEGEDVPNEPPLATASSPAGLVVCTSTVVGLIRGGHWQKLTSSSLPAAAWATAATFGDVTMVARVPSVAPIEDDEDAILRCYRVAASPDSDIFSIAGRGRLLTLTDASLSPVGVEHTIFRNGDEPEGFKTFLWGTFVDAQHFIYAVLVNDLMAGEDYLEIRAVWVEANDNTDRLVRRITLAEDDELTLPDATWLSNRICGGRLGNGHALVVFPTAWDSQTDSLRAISVVFDDSALTTSTDVSSVFTITNDGRQNNYTYPLEFLPIGNLRGFIWCRNIRFFYDITLTSRSQGFAVGVSQNSVIRGTARDAFSLTSGEKLIFTLISLNAAEGSWGLAAFQIAQNGVTSRRFMLSIPNIDARAQSALAADCYFSLKGIDDGKHYARLSRGGVSDKGAALYLPGLALTTRTPQWGPWKTRMIPSSVCGALGCDADGCTCLALLRTTSTGPQTVTFAVSGLP